MAGGVRLKLLRRLFRPSRFLLLTVAAVVLTPVFFVNWHERTEKVSSDSGRAPQHRRPSKASPKDGYFRDISYFEARANLTVANHTFSVPMVLLDARYNPASLQITALFIHPLNWDSWRLVAGITQVKPGRFSCLIDGERIQATERLIPDPHKHSTILLCPVPAHHRGKAHANVTFIDLSYESFGSISRLISTLESDFWVEHTRRHRLISCTSPLYERSRYLAEWIEFHSYLGVEHFYIYGWDLDDQLMSLAKTYSDLGLATLVNWTLPLPPEGLHYQPQAQMHCLYMFGQNSDWVMYNDVDEFFLPISNDTRPHLPSVLDNIAAAATAAPGSPSCVATITSMEIVFGPANNSYDRSNQSHMVLDHFIYSAAAASPGVGKWFAAPRYTEAVSVHLATQVQTGCQTITADPQRQLRHHHYKLAQRDRSSDPSHSQVRNTDLLRYVPIVRGLLRQKGLLNQHVRTPSIH